jgi:hypothetical protein
VRVTGPFTTALYCADYAWQLARPRRLSRVLNGLWS